MAELGNRANVMGPQPIARIVEPPPAMITAADALLAALIAGRRAEIEAAADPQARDAMRMIADSVKPGAYDKVTIIGQARIAKHWYTKARLTGRTAKPFTLQFRLGQENADGNDGGRWSVREATNLTEVRSAWSK
ncbi:MAG TPA: hypothetical protein VMV27_15435 [Candidatus Binataceae bacterium]|nr:hypothetical protein [Candidatus Binataceae bacterium]